MSPHNFIIPVPHFPRRYYFGSPKTVESHYIKDLIIFHFLLIFLSKKESSPPIFSRSPCFRFVYTKHITNSCAITTRANIESG